MNNYFINPELKKSSIILLGLMTLFLTFTLFIFKLHHQQLKRAYIKSFGAIAVRVIEKEPTLEKEIMPLITKGISEEEAVKGQEILQQYGITEELDNVLFPYFNTAILQNNSVILFLFTLMIGILFIMNYFQYTFFYKRIKKLTIGAKKVVEGQYDIALQEDQEGELSKLANAFNAMGQIIRSHLEELKKEKQFLVDLLSDISHQLKTPLSSMIVYNDIMVSKELSKEQQQMFLQNNEKQLHRMEALIKSILKLAKLDANAIALHKEKESFNETIEDAIDRLQSKAVEGKVQISFQSKQEVVFPHDRLWLEEALMNIIKNGIEHTPQGGTIHIELLENPLYQRVMIKDTGEGIREEDLPNIFKRFYKAKNARKNDSIGIGLALAKAIIELHMGMIEARSQVGVGTEFIITFMKY